MSLNGVLRTKMLTFTLGFIAGSITAMLFISLKPNCAYLEDCPCEKKQDDSDEASKTSLLHTKPLFVRGELDSEDAQRVVKLAMDPRSNTLLKARSILTRNYSQTSYEVFHDSQNGTTSIADDIHKTVRVLCLILTYPANHRSHADHVQATWARRCHKVIYVTDAADDKLGVNVFVVSNSTGRKGLLRKVSAAFDHVYRNYINEYDWFLKADDDTYVIMENLHYFLSAKNTSAPVYFGHLFVAHAQRYHSGGAGYVLGREALRRWSELRESNLGCSSSRILNENFRSPDSEDLRVGVCMEALGVRITNTLDTMGKTRFHSFGLSRHLEGNYPGWYINTHDPHHGQKSGAKWISSHAISFHYVKPRDLYTLDYLIYGLTLYGINPFRGELTYNADSLDHD